jgi:hypothetical protein
LTFYPYYDIIKIDNQQDLLHLKPNKMKMYLVLLLALTSIAAHAQRKGYLVSCIMPDGSAKMVGLIVSADGRQEFLRIARQNMMNVAPVVLSEKNIEPGQRIMTSEQPTISESTAYRFLANQFCDNCSTPKVLDKSKGARMFTRKDSGEIEMVCAFWSTESQRWDIVFVPSSELAASYVQKFAMPVYY